MLAEVHFKKCQILGLRSELYADMSESQGEEKFSITVCFSGRVK